MVGWELVVAAVFATTTVVMNLPQAWRLARTRDVAGLSAAALSNGSVNYAAWLVYLYAADEMFAWAVTVAGALPWFAIAAYAVPRLGVPVRVWAPVLGWAAVLAGLAVVDVTVFGVVLGVSVVTTYVPASWSAWTAARITGLSTPGWLLAGSEGTAMLAYGAVVADPAMLAYGVCATAGCVTVLAAIGLRRDARRPGHDAVETNPTR